MFENKCIAIVLAIICGVAIVIVVLGVPLSFGLGFGLKKDTTTELMEFNSTQNASFSVAVV